MIIKKKSINSNKIDSYQKELPLEIINKINSYKENSHRFVNKIILKNDYFELTISTKTKELSISKKKNVIYSNIPYDTARQYMQTATFHYLLNKFTAIEYIKKHEFNIKMYIEESLRQLGRLPKFNYAMVIQKEYSKIFSNPLFSIQIIGRMLQHDDTGPISASLPKKFLYDENKSTGIYEYLYQYIKFTIELFNEVPIITNENTKLLKLNTQEFNVNDKSIYKNQNSHLKNISNVAQEIGFALNDMEKQLGEQYCKKPLLKTELVNGIQSYYKDYIPHSVDPKILEPYFKNVLAQDNMNLINVVSDIHVTDGKLPFFNSNFNIIAGDILDSKIYDHSIKGVCVIGNHELFNLIDEKKSKWKKFTKYKWFQLLLEDPDKSWPLLPMGDHEFYELIKDEFQNCFPKMIILNNDFIIYEGIRYVGLTIPVVFIHRKKEVQKYIFNTLNKLLKNDKCIPTVLISHAPLFNELSMLSPKSSSYNKHYFCSDLRIPKLLKAYNIVGVIHGHHHIPASQGIFKKTHLFEKNIFIVCSIYSKINTGFELMSLL